MKNNLTITAQKTSIEDGKRNSILPCLKDIGYKLIINKRTDSVEVFDWIIKIANLVWIKWAEDWISEWDQINVMLWWSDFILDLALGQKQDIIEILKTNIWECNFELLTSEEITEISDLNKFNFLSKYQNLSNYILKKAWIKSSVSKSQWSDNAMARRSERWEKLASMELIESWNTAKSLWLFRPRIKELIMPVSTNLYLKPNSLSPENAEKLSDFAQEIEWYFYAKENSLLEFDIKSWIIDINQVPELKWATISPLQWWGVEYRIYLAKNKINEIRGKIKRMWAEKIFKSTPKIYYPDNSNIEQTMSGNIKNINTLISDPLDNFFNIIKNWINKFPYEPSSITKLDINKNRLIQDIWEIWIDLVIASKWNKEKVKKIIIKLIQNIFYLLAEKNISLKNIIDELKKRDKFTDFNWSSSDFLFYLNKKIENRKKLKIEWSLTSKLFKKWIKAIRKKVWEEVIEVILATTNSNNKEIICEISDLFYFLMILIAENEIDFKEFTRDLITQTD